MREGVRAGERETKRAGEGGVIKFERNLEEGDLMNGRTRVKGQLPGDKAVTNRGTGKGLRGEGQQNTGRYQSTWTVTLGYVHL